MYKVKPDEWWGYHNSYRNVARNIESLYVDFWYLPQSEELPSGKKNESLYLTLHINKAKSYLIKSYDFKTFIVQSK